ncbi:MAG TPA: 4a-hydroxytetrahydrobiopterin dehydratase [Candidatus Rifleibacterium sp.]|nr:4a-hydroxytetrahydrobiopterin dehydratase [Candidatus Rifleibacterium sp.]HPT46133.1 4a-hydroxytetrahydrobiopterin dehydratase [Candidatus Rifleibacterium sp.]
MEHRVCVPCSSETPPLSRESCETFLAGLPEWQLDADAKEIVRKFVFKDFAQALDFAVKVGRLAEEMGHHPVITLGWGFCKVKFKTSKINGLHKNDFVMAAHVNKL